MFLASSKLKEELLSQQRKSCRDITFRIHNQEQQNICRDKDYFCCDKQNMKEVNSLLRQEAEEQHQKNDDKENFVATQSRAEGKTCVVIKKFFVVTIKAME